MPETAIEIIQGDCLEVMAQMKADGVLLDGAITDPPYHLSSIVKRFLRTSVDDDSHTGRRARDRSDALARLSRGFMGKEWDGGEIAFEPATWRAVYDILKPGAHIVAFAAGRNYHRMAVAIEDAGFEIRTMLGWIYGSGFPKTKNVEKMIREIMPTDRSMTREEWATARHLIRLAANHNAGAGTELKPAIEPICLARKPISESSVAANIIRWGTGALQVGRCRIEVGASDARDVDRKINRGQRKADDGYGMNRNGAEAGVSVIKPEGRYPANIMHDGSEEVLAAFPDSLGQESAVQTEHGRKTAKGYGSYRENADCQPRGDDGSAARFFYSAKAQSGDRLGSKHPTVKPVGLMSWLARLICPPGGTIIDPFAGTGSTGIGARVEGIASILVEREEEYVADIHRRVEFISGRGGLMAIEKARLDNEESRAAAAGLDTPLFAEL